jgi:hypothetical protein
VQAKLGTATGVFVVCFDAVGDLRSRRGRGFAGQYDWMDWVTDCAHTLCVRGDETLALAKLDTAPGDFIVRFGAVSDPSSRSGLGFRGFCVRRIHLMLV